MPRFGMEMCWQVQKSLPNWWSTSFCCQSLRKFPAFGNFCLARQILTSHQFSKKVLVYSQQCCAPQISFKQMASIVVPNSKSTSCSKIKTDQRTAPAGSARRRGACWPAWPKAETDGAAEKVDVSGPSGQTCDSTDKHPLLQINSPSIIDISVSYSPAMLPCLNLFLLHVVSQSQRSCCFPPMSCHAA